MNVLLKVKERKKVREGNNSILCARGLPIATPR